jgi:hypothetical protein
MPKADTELVVIEKTHELLVWTLKHIEKFPRNHRYGLGLRLEQRITEILELLLRAKYRAGERATLLAQTNLSLELLRFQFRSVKDVKCLSLESYGSASRFVNEIGKLVGGWIKQTHGGMHETSRKPVAGTGQLPKPAPSSAASRSG